MEYFKLGEKASIFYDPSTQVLIRQGEVQAFKSLPKSKKVGLARRNGHITSASEEEYNNYLATLDNPEDAPIVVPSKPKTKDKDKDLYEYNPELLTLTPDQFRKKLAEESGFLDEDLDQFEKLKDIKKMIKLFDEINKEYQ
jgi:hypothetical protein